MLARFEEMRAEDPIVVDHHSQAEVTEKTVR